MEHSPTLQLYITNKQIHLPRKKKLQRCIYDVKESPGIRKVAYVNDLKILEQTKEKNSHKSC